MNRRSWTIKVIKNKIQFYLQEDNIIKELVNKYGI